MPGCVERTPRSATDCDKRRKGRTFGARGGPGAAIKKTDKTSRSQSHTTASAVAPTSLGMEDDIQEMVDAIKSRNLNNGGGRQAKGGPWIREPTLRLFLKII